MAGAELIVCTTCRGPGRVSGVGAALAGAVAAGAAAPAYAALAVTPVACLWSCAQGASAQLRAAGKTGYVMGGFVAGDAAALLDFAAAYAATADGTVPYDRWPSGILGHFIARTPPPAARSAEPRQSRSKTTVTRAVSATSPGSTGVASAILARDIIITGRGAKPSPPPSTIERMRATWSPARRRTAWRGRAPPRPRRSGPCRAPRRRPRRGRPGR